MIRLNPISNARVRASALPALAAAIGLMLIPAAPARADHVEHAFAHHLGRVAASHFLLAGELLFGPPVPVPVPVVVHREVVYEAPVVYERPHYRHVVRHAHYRGCGHGGWGHGKHGRHHKHHRGEDRWEGHRGRY
jgi:hypothetical protein